MSAIDIAQALWLLVAALGLSVSVAYAGLPVLAQSAYIAVGGYGVALLGPGGIGLPLGIAAAVAVVMAGILGFLAALGLSRAEGAYLALATWALAWLVQRVLLAYPTVFGGPEGLTRPVPPHLVSRLLGVQILLTTNVNLAIAALLCVITLLAVLRMDRGWLGGDLAALRESPILAASLGVPIASRRRTAFVVTALLGAISGAGSTLLLGIISPSDVSPLVSLQLFVAVLIGGAQWWGPVLGVAIVSVLPWAADQLANATGTSAEHLRGVLTALLLFAVLVLRSLLRGRLRHPMRLSTEAPQMYAGTTKDHVAAKKQPIELSAAGLSISYAGVQALDRISIALRGGKVHALVGPNGSGKSTLLAVLAGELRHGEIRINGKLHRARSVRDRVLAGIVRTPQPAQVFTSLTPAGQVALGARAASRLRGAALRQLLATPRSRVEVQRVRATVADALCETGLERISDTDPAQLTVGERQLLQVARAIATGASVFLFDEPAAGMTPVERKVLADVVRGLTAGGAAVLLVEHDMRLVGAVADYVSVIDAGRTIAAGSPERIRIEPRVREVYLGSS